MAVRIGDTLKQINNADFPIVEAMDVAFESGDTLQELYDSGALSGGGGASYITLSQEEYDVLSDEEKVNGSEYRTYDTGHIYKLGIEYGKDGVQISDNETVENKTWSSQKTSDEIAKVETELEDYMNIKYNLLEPSTDLNTLIVAGMYMSKWGYSNSLVNKPSGFSSDYEVIVTVTPLKRIGNYGEYIEQTFVSRAPKSPVYRRIIENKAPTQPAWTELATMDKVVKQVVVDARAFENVASAWTSKIYPHVKQGGCYMLNIMTKGGMPHILMLSTEIGTEGIGFFVEWGGGIHTFRFNGTEFAYF